MNYSQAPQYGMMSQPQQLPPQQQQQQQQQQPGFEYAYRPYDPYEYYQAQQQAPQQQQIPQQQQQQIQATQAPGPVPMAAQSLAATSNSRPSPVVEKLAQVLPRPPLSMAQIRPESLVTTPPKRARRRSKYTKEQDEMIVQLKKAGKSWVAIADITGVGSFLAARNRYQVLIGQQGGGTSECDAEDIRALHSLIDEGEVEKWRYISKELHKVTGKNFTDRELQEIVRYLFWSNPEAFGITDEYYQQYMKKVNATPSASSHSHTASVTGAAAGINSTSNSTPSAVTVSTSGVPSAINDHNNNDNHHNINATTSKKEEQLYSYPQYSQ